MQGHIYKVKRMKTRSMNGQKDKVKYKYKVSLRSHINIRSDQGRRIKQMKIRSMQGHITIYLMTKLDHRQNNKASVRS